LTLAFWNSEPSLTRRKWKQGLASLGVIWLSHFYRCYWVPWGVPDEFKVRNQVAACFESALFCCVPSIKM
jgi:hypothetical protein